MSDILLRELLERSAPPREAWADAAHHARRLFGDDVAANIRWWTDKNDAVLGLLTGGDGVIVLRYEADEPGTERIAAHVPCPQHRCGDCWDRMRGNFDLLGVLDGHRNDPRCDTSHDG